MSKKSKKKKKDAYDLAVEGKGKQRQSHEVNQKLGNKEYEAELFKLQVELHPVRRGSVHASKAARTPEGQGL
jgi:hypothetical protein